MKNAAKKSRISAGAIYIAKPLVGKRSQKPSRLAREGKTGEAMIRAKPKYGLPRQLNSAQAESPAVVGSSPRDNTPGKSFRGKKKTAPLASCTLQPTIRMREENSAGSQVMRTGEAPAIVSQDTFQTVPGQNYADRLGSDTHYTPVGAGLAFEPCPIIPIIVQQWRLRQRWHKAEKTLVLQGKALCRSFTDGDKKEAGKIWDSVCDGECTDDAFLIALTPLVDAYKSLESRRATLEKTLKKMARDLPAYSWMKEVYGLGELSMAAIAGEAGDIRTYGNPAKLWKRFGLAVIGGERQRKKTNIVDAELHGYNPSRRSVMWNIGNGLIGCMGKGPRPIVGEDISKRDDLSPYQKLFIERLREEALKNPEHRKDDREKNGELYESYSKHAFNRAKRYVEKRFLRQLWSAWRAATGEMIATENAPPN